MLSIPRQIAGLLLLSLSITGCINFDFGSDDPVAVDGCGATPVDVTDDLADRYAVGSTATFSLRGLENPKVTSSKPDVVDVSVDEEPPAVDGSSTKALLVTLSFVGVGEASVRVAEYTDDGALIDAASATVTVAEAEGFQVVLPFHVDRAEPLAGKAVIDPELRVAYFDVDGRLHGRGLAETDWERKPSATDDIFFNHDLEPGLHQVEVRAVHRRSVIRFEAVARDEVEALELIETELGGGRIRLDLVGVTASGTQVWNILPVFRIDGWFHAGSFEYVFDPDAEPSTLEAYALAFQSDDFDVTETTIYRERPPGEYATHAAATVPAGGRAPLMALVSLLLMTGLIQIGTGRR